MPVLDYFKTAKACQLAGFQGYVWTGRTYGYSRDDHGATWLETERPTGGEQVWCSDLRQVQYGETADLYEVPLTVWGDYVGSTVERSNFQSLDRDYPETFVSVGYGHGGNALFLPAAAVLEDAEEFVNMLTGLRDQYAVYDESDLSELEVELAWDAWEAYLQHETARDLEAAGVDLECLSDDLVRQTYYGATSEIGSCGPYCEDATGSVVFPDHDAVVEHITPVLTFTNLLMSRIAA